MIVRMLLFLSSLLLAITTATSSSSSTPFALLYEQIIADEDGSIFGTIQIFDDGHEAADTLYAFSRLHELDDEDRAIILDDICASSTLTCNRLEAVVYSSSVAIAPKAGEEERRLFEVYEGVEPIDAVIEFERMYNMTMSWRNEILRGVCDELECTRLQPLLFSLDVDLGSGESDEDYDEEDEEEDEEGKDYSLNEWIKQGD
jgi:hypothetical protein